VKVRGPGGNPVTAEEATASLSALEEKILGQYNLAKVNSFIGISSFN
jgi:hypothetical protein